jgi:paraquat-inducible protein B
MQPVLKKRRWPYLLIWLVPVLVAVGVGFYFKDYFEHRGPLVTIKLNSAEGLRPGETPLLHRGVTIGQVAGIELSEDHRHALVKVRLERHQEDFAKEGASFWIVRPEVSISGLQGLGTLISGPYIDSAPGNSDGAKKTFFTGMPKAADPFGEGLELTVHAPLLDHLQDHSPVYYRGIQVGAVRDIRLGNQADRIEAHIVVWRRYVPLVRSHSKFWAMSGFDAKGGLFSGVTLKLESLKAIVSGALAFATPDKDMGDPVRDGADFALEKEEPDHWADWAPKIPIKPASSSGDDLVSEQMAGQGAFGKAFRSKHKRSAEE